MKIGDVVQSKVENGYVKVKYKIHDILISELTGIKLLLLTYQDARGEINTCKSHSDAFEPYVEENKQCG